jgi:hypothetical protein
MQVCIAPRWTTAVDAELTLWVERRADVTFKACTVAA